MYNIFVSLLTSNNIPNKSQTTILIIVFILFLFKKHNILNLILSKKFEQILFTLSQKFIYKTINNITYFLLGVATIMFLGNLFTANNIFISIFKIVLWVNFSLLLVYAFFATIENSKIVNENILNRIIKLLKEIKSFAFFYSIASYIVIFGMFLSLHKVPKMSYERLFFSILFMIFVYLLNFPFLEFLNKKVYNCINIDNENWEILYSLNKNEVLLISGDKNTKRIVDRKSIYDKDIITKYEK